MSDTGDIYQTDGTTISKENGVSSFDVKGGYYKYQVVVNQAGELDITGVELKDVLGEYMQYAGFLRIDAYDSLMAEETLDGTELPEIEESILQTAWLDIDGLTTFKFEPKNLGFSGAESYVLTYYVKIVYTGDDLYITATNSFTASGYGVAGSAKYLLTNLGVGVSFSASTSSSFQAEKYAWYYENPGIDEDASTGDWGKGALYWYIKVSGTEIPAGTVWKDLVASTNHELVGDESLVGVYEIATGSEPLTMDNVLGTCGTGADPEGTAIDASKYKVGWDDDSNGLTIAFPDKVSITDGKDVIIVIKTSILNAPGAWSAATYKNNLYQSNNNGSSFQQVGESVNQVVNGAKTCEKTLADKIGVYDGKSWYNLDGTSHLDGSWGNYLNSDKSASLVTEPGTYIEYKLNTCMNGNVTGDVEFSDVIPEGLEIAIFRNQWYHNTNSNTTVLPTADNVEIEELENNPDWEKFTEGNKKDSMATSEYCIYYYNSKTRELRWKLSNVQVPNSGIIDFQLLLRVTDEDVLNGTKVGSYINTLKVYQDGKLIDKSTAAEVTLSKTTLDKDIAGTIVGTKIPFKIVVNNFSEDLLEKGTEITLVDELGANLNLDIDSIKVLDKEDVDVTDSEDVAIGLSVQNGKTILRITLPDDQKFTITYNTKVCAVNGETVKINNIAHWEGYEPTDDSEIENKSITIDLGGSVNSSGHASLKLTKRDEEDVLKKLAGATFEMQEAIYDSSTGDFRLTGEVHEATTGEDGVAYFAKDETWMKYDTVYCITETSAPDGYDAEEPRYILLASSNYAGDAPEIVEVQQGDSQYEFTALDKELSTPFSFPQTGGPGIQMLTLWGAAFMTLSVAGYIVIWVSRRRKEDK
jgi:hypothetical protein